MTGVAGRDEPTENDQMNLLLFVALWSFTVSAQLIFNFGVELPAVFYCDAAAGSAELRELGVAQVRLAPEVRNYSQLIVIHFFGEPDNPACG